MAKAKKLKRKKNTRADFYEAVPMAPVQPIYPPDLTQQLKEASAAVRDLWRLGAGRFAGKPRQLKLFRLEPRTSQQLQKAATWSSRGFSEFIQTTGAVVGQAATGLKYSGLFGMTLVRSGAGTVADYAPAAAADLRRVLGGIWGILSSRRFRLILLALASGGLFALVTVGASLAVSTVNSYANDISSPAALLAKKKIGTTILDRNGQVLFEGYGAQATKTVQLSELPQSLKDATLAAEDPGFYDHPGFSWRGTARAAWVDITHGNVAEGGSTLTQQLVKNALLTSNKNFERKYQEILLAMELEHRYSKDQILDMYLNEIYYGQGSSGVEAASQTYFHKPSSQLTLGESALLAGLPLGPGRFDPNADLAAATGRRDYVLGRMAELHKITPAQAAAAKAQPIQLASAGAPQTGAASPMLVYSKVINIQAPHFVFYVLDQLRAKYGEDVVEQGGITVTTTLDLTKQHEAEKAVSYQISKLGYHHVTNGGLISLSPTTGDILAMVGSVDYNAPGFGNVNVTLSDLQPGSSFKPIAYATAFEKGWNGATTVEDAPFSAPGGDGTLYVPHNYDGKFRGTVTLRRALDNSLNIPAIKVLQFAGIPDTLKTAHDMGITTLNDPSRYGLSLVLGGGEVRPIDMATVYGTLENGGTRVSPRAILKVTDRHGANITKPEAPTSAQVLDPRIAYMLTNILSDNAARTEEFGANSPLKLSRPAAAKTGTTNDFRDNWTVGYTPQLVTAVWVGNNDHSPMQGVDGITGAAPIWHDYMEAASSGMPVEDFTVPPGITTAKVCTSNGGLVNSPSDPGYNEVFPSDAVETKRCNFAVPKPSPTPTPAIPGGLPVPSDNPAATTPQPTTQPRHKTKPN